MIRSRRAILAAVILLLQLSACASAPKPASEPVGSRPQGQTPTPPMLDPATAASITVEASSKAIVPTAAVSAKSTAPTIEISDYYGEELGAAFPVWINVEIIELEKAEKYKKFYLFRTEERAANLEALALQLELVNAESAVAKKIEERIREHWKDFNTDESGRYDAFLKIFWNGFPRMIFKPVLAEKTWIIEKTIERTEQQRKTEEIAIGVFLYAIERNELRSAVKVKITEAAIVAAPDDETRERIDRMCDALFNDGF